MWNKHVRMALLGAGLLALAACQKMTMENGTPALRQGMYTLTVEATKGADTKSLDLSGSSLNATWENGETVAVYLGGQYLGDLTATVSGASSHTASLSGTLNSATGIEENAVLTLLFPSDEWSYTGQRGTLVGISCNYDYALASVTIQSIDVNGQITTSANAVFSNQQSVYRFSFVKDGNPFNAAYFTVSAKSGKLVASRSYSGGWVSSFGPVDVSLGKESSTAYVALRNDNTSANDTYSFDVTDTKNAVYVGGKSIASEHLGNGKYLGADVELTQARVSKAAGSLSKENIL